jgi:hypothetical protein
VPEDGCGSPPPHHAAGLDRLRGADVTVTTIKGLYYEWVRDLATLSRVKAEIGAALPAGLTL